MNDLASALISEVDGAEKYFRSLTEAEAMRSRGGGKWVKKQILGHLIDSATNNHQRFIRAQFADPFIWPGYDQEAWVPLHRYNDRPWAELVNLWGAFNRHVAVAIGSVPADKLQTSCIIGGNEPVSLEWLMRDYIHHMKHHIGQIFGI